MTLPEKYIRDVEEGDELNYVKWENWLQSMVEKAWNAAREEQEDQFGMPCYKYRTPQDWLDS